MYTQHTQANENSCCMIGRSQLYGCNFSYNTLSITLLGSQKLTKEEDTFPCILPEEEKKQINEKEEESK